MPKIDELLRQYGTSLQETRALAPQLLSEFEERGKDVIEEAK